MVITLVCGPPCSGKSRYVDQCAEETPGALVVCHDRYARDAGSSARHAHDGYFHDVAEQMMRRRFDLLHYRQQAAEHVYVIRSVPEAYERGALAEYIRATRVLVFMPPIEIALERASRDQRAQSTWGVIRAWYERYEPREGDEVWPT